jgi:4-hydroxybenzoate polyprenyltransferase
MNPQPHMTKPSVFMRLFVTMGYLAIWPALYTLAVYLLISVFMITSSGGWKPISLVLICAHSCYLLDRVKLSDARQDPADSVALPDRAILFARFARFIRAFVVLELLATSMIAWLIHPLLSLMPLLALIGVHIYAGRGACPGSPRVKDLYAIKSFLIASAHIAFPLVILLALEPDELINLAPNNIILFCSIWLIIAGDASLCDIDDHDADRLYSTRSIAVLIGPSRAWLFAFVLILAGSTTLYITQQSTIWISVGLVGTAVLSRNVNNHRDLVDARMLPLVLTMYL